MESALDGLVVTVHPVTGAARLMGAPAAILSGLAQHILWFASLRPTRVIDLDSRLAERFADLLSLPAAVSDLLTRVHELEQDVATLRQGDPTQLLTTEQAAAFLAMTPAAVRKAAERGTLPTERLGRRLRFRRGALLAWRRH